MQLPSTAELAKIWQSNFQQCNEVKGFEEFDPKFPSPAERRQSCRKLAAAASHHQAHIRNLSRTLSDILEVRFFHCGNVCLEVITTSAKDLLARLPITSSPLKIPFDLENGSVFGPEYIRTTTHHRGTTAKSAWGSIRVTSYIGHTVQYVALLIALQLHVDNEAEPWRPHVIEVARISAAAAHLERILNGLASLLEETSRNVNAATNVSSCRRWFLATAFLWTTWQRCMMLFRFWQLSLNSYGFAHPGPGILEKIHVQMIPCLGPHSSCGQAELEIPAFLCKWAFGALRASPKLHGLDFRGLLDHVTAKFGHLSPRCLVSQRLQCDGYSPYNCQRFCGMEIKDQSAHDSLYCSPTRWCASLAWDKSSYLYITGARAVLLDSSDEGRLRYTAVSSSTLAITHTWIHGQGGRPEVGMNLCLHRRYCAAARAIGCTSYWIDTACIPSDHDLRQEAILEINKTFMSSRATVILDKDLMAIDIENRDTDTDELMVTTLLICDWNWRAWTMLEAFKGWHNLFILCKNNRMVSVSDIVTSVLRRGKIDICCAFLSSVHLIPHQNQSDISVGASHQPKTLLSGPIRHFSIDKAGALLCYRQASRPGDEIIIWSLICGSEVYNNADCFWRGAGSGRKFSSIYLISSIPRVQNRFGFSWAPTRPNIEPPVFLQDREFIPPLDVDSDQVHVTTKGLVGNWFCAKFLVDHVLSDSGENKCSNQLQRITYRYGLQCRWIALLQASTIQNPKRCARYIWRSSGTVVAVVSSDDGHDWTWKGVYVWDHEMEALPDFFIRRLSLV
ncbi:hypothetical protein V8E51_016236 [Hyaloscypha variabilis]